MDRWRRSMRTLGQKRAAFALKKVLAYKDIAKFKPFSAGAPSSILQNGFGQTIAFWFAKGMDKGIPKNKDKHVILFDILKDWLTFKNADIDNDYMLETDRIKFIQELNSKSQTDYLKIQNEALALLEWIKRYASAFCKEE